jgi:hypothetical protein
MGGLLSSRWGGHDTATTVEGCLDLDASRGARDGILAVGGSAAGAWKWTYLSGGSFGVHYDADTQDLDQASIRLSYAWVWTATGRRESAAYRVGLTTTRPHFGGLRWWFVCPLSVEGTRCGRRVGKLYLPPAGGGAGPTTAATWPPCRTRPT